MCSLDEHAGEQNVDHQYRVCTVNSWEWFHSREKGAVTIREARKIPTKSEQFHAVETTRSEVCALFMSPNRAAPAQSCTTVKVYAGLAMSS